MEFEKYAIEVPARIEVISSQEEESLYLRTASVSAKEVFFHTADPLPENVQVRLDLLLNFTKSANISTTGITILIHVTGKVVRSEQAGMKIILNEDYQITKLCRPVMSERASLPVETWY
jgi:hypothetical protein